MSDSIFQDSQDVVFQDTNDVSWWKGAKMPSGIEVQAAIKKASTWGTAVACGAGAGILLTGDSLKKTIAGELDDSLGNAYAGQRDQGEIVVEGGLPGYLRYDGHDVPISLCSGDTQTPTLLDTLAYSNSIKLADKIDGLFATLAVNKVVNIFEYLSVKVTGFTIRGQMGKPVEIEYDLICDDEEIASSVNTPSTFNNVSYFEVSNRVLFSQGVFRLNDESGAALASGDKIYPASFELSFKRNLSGEYVAGNANKIDEPTSDELPVVQLKLSFPRYTATTYLAALVADTRKKMDIVFTGALIEAAYSREFKLQLPHLALNNAEAATEKGKIIHPLEFDCLGTTTAPNGMTGILKPFQIDVINRYSVNPLL